MYLSTSTDAFLSNLDSLLQPICHKLQLSPSSHDQVENRYGAVGKWLRNCPKLSKFEMRLFAQGSYALGTTVRPLGKCEFDLDFVLLLGANSSQIGGPISLLDVLEHRLGIHDTYAGMIERKNRCIRVKYANFFHIDILPAIPDPSAHAGCLLVPDHKAQTWKASNPEGFRDWFKTQATEKRLDSREQEPLPAYQTLEQKCTLQCAVQLIKRWRDIHFAAWPKHAPVSIVLTTLAAQNYNSQLSVEASVQAILDGILTQITQTQPGNRLVVLNPSNHKEDLSERWNDPVCYRAFMTGIRDFQAKWHSLSTAKGLSERTEILKELFGEELTQEVVREHAKSLAERSSSNGLGSIRGKNTQTGIIVPVSSVGSAAIRKHNFYGDE